MSPTFVCKACGLERERNYRLGNKEQQYCRDRDCQRERRREYQRNRLHSQPSYCQKQRICRVRWRHHKVSLAKYQRAYRVNHPEYTAKNRQQQQLRNAKRRQKSVSKPNPVAMPDPVIVKMNSCSLDFSKTSVDTIDYVSPTRVIVSDSIDPAREIRDILTQKIEEH